MPRGRPKGSKNKPKVGNAAISPVRKRGRPPKTDHLFNIEAGPVAFTFPIVQEDTVKKPVAFLTVNSDSFKQALRDAVRWSREWSTSKSGDYFPLVKYGAEKRYIMAVGSFDDPEHHTYAYAENREVGSWIPIETLEVV